MQNGENLPSEPEAHHTLQHCMASCSLVYDLCKNRDTMCYSMLIKLINYWTEAGQLFLPVSVFQQANWLLPVALHCI